MGKQDAKSSKVSVWCIISMASIPLVMTLGNSMLIPILPIFEKKINITSFQTSMVITSYSIASIFLIPVAGYLSDRFGRKKVLLPSLIITLIGGLIAGYASWKMDSPYSWIIIGRVLQGIGASGATPIVLPLVGDLFKDDDEKISSTLGIIETSNTFGKVLSPILGSAFAAVLWFLPFFSISFFSLLAIVLVIFFIKAPKDRDKPKKFKEFIKSTQKTFKEEGKWLSVIFLIGVFVMLVLFAVLFFLSDSLEKLHQLHGIKKGFVLAIPLFFLCLSSFIAGKKIKGDLKKMRIIILASLILMSLSVAFVGFTKDKLILLLIVVGVLGIAIGLMLPTLDAIITENIEKEQCGTISAFYMSARFIGVAGGPPLMSVAAKNYLNITYLSFSVAGLIILFLAIKLIKSDDPKKTKKA